MPYEMSATVTGATHAYGPVGAAIGAFAGFCDQATIEGIAGALRDSASAEFDWYRKATDPAEAAYHQARWREQNLAAGYAELMAGIPE